MIPRPTLLLVLLCLWMFPRIALAAEYTVVIDGHSYDVREGEPRSINLPKGPTVRLEVRKKDPLSYHKHGLSFRYSSDMTLTEATETQSRILSLERADSTLVMLYQQLKPVDAEEAAEGVLEDVQQQFIQSGVSYPEGSIHPSPRVIAGEIVSGKRMLTRLGTNQIETEAYGIHRKGQTLVLLFQADQEDRLQAEPYFKTVAESLTLAAEK